MIGWTYRKSFKTLSRLALCLTVLSLVGCGRSPTVEPALQGLVTDFEQLTGTSNSSDVLFVDSSDTKPWGVCSDGVVSINKHVWTLFTDTIWQRTILYHELGHCNLGLKHVDDDQSFMRKAPPNFRTREELEQSVLRAHRQ